MKTFYDHYQVSQPTVSRALSRLEKEGTLASKKWGRCGRIGYIGSPEFQAALRAANHNLRGQSSRLLAKLGPKEGTTYRGEAGLVPAKNTVLAAKKLAGYITHSVKLRPAIRPELRPVRVDFAQWILENAGDHTSTWTTTRRCSPSRS